MDALNAIRAMISDSGNTLVGVCRAMGRSDAYLNATFSQGGSPNIALVKSVADVCGYDIQLVPHGRKPPRGAITID